MGMSYRGHAILACVPDPGGDRFFVAAQRMRDKSFTTFRVTADRKVYSEPDYGIPDLASAVAAMLDRAGYPARCPHHHVTPPGPAGVT
jgi:hypothetical protein